MSKINQKKIVLLTSGIIGGILIFLLLGLLYNFSGSYRQVYKDLFTPLVYICSSFPFIFILSLITYRLPEQVFRAWWNFARWWVPVIIVITILLNNAGSGGGYIGMDSMFDGFVYLILYGVLIVTSLVKIYRAYRKGN